MQGRRFDVFLCHHGADDAVVEHIAERLRGKGIQPWLDRWHLALGDAWQREISQGLRASSSCAVFVGSHGLGDWAREELAVAQDRAAKDRDFRLFMVLLPGALKPDDPSFPAPARESSRAPRQTRAEECIFPRPRGKTGDLGQRP